MADKTEDRGPQDRARISMDQDYEVRYWSEKFGVGEEQLRQAVESVGNSAAAVETYLAGH